MNTHRRNAIVAVAMMVAALGGAIAWRPRKRLADERETVELETMFPKHFGSWVVDERMPVQLVSPDQKAVLDAIYNQTLSRTYVDKSSGDRIMLSVAYGGDQSDATRAHRPEVCYPAQGFQILTSRQAMVTTGERALRVRQLVAKQGNRIEPISYWIIVGDKLTITGTEQKLAQLGYSTRGSIPDGMLVRVSNIDPDPEKAYRLQSRFLSDLASALSPSVLSRVMGA